MTDSVLTFFYFQIFVVIKEIVILNSAKTIRVKTEIGQECSVCRIFFV